MLKKGRNMSSIKSILRAKIREDYHTSHLHELHTFLHEHGTFNFPSLANGLYSAALVNQQSEYTGYHNVWVRDNIHIAHARYVTGYAQDAARTMQALFQYFNRHRHRFTEIIRREADPRDVMQRPHVRFNGTTGEEISEKWDHAQNDALGYFLWFYSLLAMDGIITPSNREIRLLALFPQYFHEIGYWQDEDSGHWEESRKIEASSIGVVVAALSMFKEYLSRHHIEQVETEAGSLTMSFLDDLCLNGRRALDHTLPSECIQPAKERRYDAALLFLIYPVRAVNSEMADHILSDVRQHLLGDYGISRYRGDSFWCSDYKEKLSEEFRTCNVSDDMSARDALLIPGEEAQWCIFDPLISTVYGLRYQTDRNPKWLHEQIFHFNRSLYQLTELPEASGQLLCPELYYKERGKYTANDVVPLLWTQANLSLAFWSMARSYE
jgi:hypothetical protein